MAIHIKIRKYIEKDSVYYYHAQTQLIDNHDFYIGIDVKKKLLLFFKDNNFLNFLANKEIGVNFRRNNLILQEIYLI